MYQKLVNIIDNKKKRFMKGKRKISKSLTLIDFYQIYVYMDSLRFQIVIIIIGESL